MNVLKMAQPPSLITQGRVGTMDMITHSAIETRQQKEQWGGGLEATLGRQYRRGFHKIGGFRTPLPNYVIVSRFLNGLNFKLGRSLAQFWDHYIKLKI